METINKEVTKHQFSKLTEEEMEQFLINFAEEWRYEDVDVEEVGDNCTWYDQDMYRFFYELCNIRDEKF